MRLAQDSWSSAFLGELCHIKIGRTPDRANSEYWGSGHPWLSITDMQQGKNLVTTKETITQKAVDECRCYQVQPGTLLMSFKLSIGKLGFAKIPMYTNEAIAALQLKDQKRLSTNYLYYALQAVNLTAGVDRAVKGMTLNTDKLNVLSIPLPRLPEQKRIATILAKADRLRRLRRYVLELSGTYLQSVFLEMFGDPVTNPKGWDTDLLINLCPGKNALVDGPFGSSISTKVDYIPDGEIPVIRTKNVRPFEFIEDDLKRINREKFEMVKRSRVIPGDIILTKVGTIGSVCIFPGHFAEAILSTTGSCKITPDTDRVERIYLAHHLHVMKDYMNQIASEGVQPFLNMETIKDFVIILPSLQLQQKFVRCVQQFERLRIQQREAERQAEHLFQTLLHKAFQGELTLDDEEMMIPEDDVYQQMPSFADVAEPIDKDAYQLALPLE